jgi:hypothetical protein
MPKRKREDDGNEEAPRRSKRARRAPYENMQAGQLSAVLTHWRNVTPAVADNLLPADQLALQMFAANHRNCAAVLTRENGNTLVAMNNWDGAAAAVAIPAGNFEQVGDSTAQLHAEMKILEYCGAKNIPIASRIGISKPSCLRCAVVMQITGNQDRYRGNSGRLYNAGWKIPSFIRRNSEHMRAFLSDDIFEWWKEISTPQKEDFLRRLESIEDRD